MSKHIDQKTLYDKYSHSILIGCTAISVILAISFWRSPLSVYDTAGHVSLIKIIASDFWPKMSGWDTSQLLGWPAGAFYPSFFHWLAAGLSFFVGVPAAVKILISTALILLPISINFFTKSLIENKLWAALTTLVLFMLVILFPNFLGTGVRSLFQIGLLSNFFVLPLVFLFLGMVHRQNLRGRGAFLAGLLAAIILTHIVAALVAGLYLLLFIKVKILTRELTRTGLVNYVKIFLLAAALTAFFWIPFILNLEYTSVSRHVSSYLLPNVAVFIIAMSIGFYGWRKKERNILLLSFFAGFLAFVATVDAYLIKTNGTSLLLYQFHIYRFQPFAYILLVTAGMLALSKNVKFDRWDLILPGVVSAGFGLIVLALLVRNPSSLPNARFSLENAQIGSGRFLETFSRTQADPFWYGIQSQLNDENKDAQWAYGLFTDSSPNGPYLGSLIKSLNPDAYPENEEEFIETKVVEMERADKYLDHLGIESLLTLEPSQISAIGELEKDGIIQYFNVEKGPDAVLFEVPDLPLKQVKNNWEAEVEKWWLEDGAVKEIPYLAKSREIQNDHFGSGQNVRIGLVAANKEKTQFKLKIDSEKPVPVLAKISYFPYWKAADKDGKEIQIYRAAPNLVLFEGKGEVSLVYQEPIWINWLYFVSAVTLVGIIFYIYRRRPLSQ